MTAALARAIGRGGLLALANACGLAATFAAVILLGGLVRYELSFNHGVDPRGEVYQIYTRLSRPGQAPVVTNGTVADLAPALHAQWPDLPVARVASSADPQKISVGSQASYEKITEADPELPQVLALDRVAGNPSLALSRPDGAILTDRASTRLFGRPDALGAAFVVNGHTYRVAAVIRPAARNTSFADVDILLSSRSPATSLGQLDAPGQQAALTIGLARTYVRASRDLEPELARVADRHARLVQARFVAQNPAAGAAGAMQIEHFPVRLWDQAKARQLGAPADPNRANATVILALCALAVLALAVAVVNFVNLATAQAVTRALEVAVRKSFGASRASLAADFLLETVGWTLVAAATGLLLAFLFRGWFASVIQRNLSLEASPPTLVGLFAAAGAIGLAAGTYPALVLSGFRPAAVLGARGAQAPGAGHLRTLLVSLQVAASVGAIALSLSVYLQLRYVTGAGLGFSDRGVVVYRLPFGLAAGDQRLQALLGEFGRVPGVQQAAAADAIPTEGQLASNTVSQPGRPAVELSSVGVTDQFFAALGVSPIAGRNFYPREVRPYQTGDAAGIQPIVLTRTAVSRLGYASPAEAIGASLRLAPAAGQVVGVTADVPMGGLRVEKSAPVIFTPAPRGARELVVKVEPSQRLSATAALDRVYSQFYPDRPVDRFFLLDRVSAAFADLSRLLALVTFFALLSLAAASLGILGASIVLAQRMTKEAGVRKAYGARARDIGLLMLARLYRPIGVGMVIGALVGLLSGRMWLAGFAKRVQTGGGPELAACTVVAVLALLVAGWQTHRISSVRPADTLRYE